MPLTTDINVHQNANMLGTELAYVRERLKRCTPQELLAVAKIAKVNPRTIRRIKSRSTEHPSSVTVGRLAMHFRTQEVRA
jgi:hypothetical protein